MKKLVWALVMNEATHAVITELAQRSRGSGRLEQLVLEQSAIKEQPRTEQTGWER